MTTSVNESVTEHFHVTPHSLYWCSETLNGFVFITPRFCFETIIKGLPQAETISKKKQYRFKIARHYDYSLLFSDEKYIAE